MINVVIPMAGAGSRFSVAGYSKPKPFIDVGGKPMITRVLENLCLPDAEYILIAQKEHISKEPDAINEIITRFPAMVVEVDGLTEGTACTVLHARKLIDNETPLIIANADQIIDFELSSFVSDCFDRKLDGSILAFIEQDRDPKWSYVEIDENRIIKRVREKLAISDIATVGIYLYSKGSYFVDAAIRMMLAQDRVNHEYYTCPTYNYLVKDLMRIGTYLIDRENMHGLGTPDDLKKYISSLKNQ